MRKSIFIILLFCLLLSFVSCEKKAYTFQQSVDKIERIDIVLAENSRESIVIKTLSEEQKKEFLDRFKEIEFGRIYFGDPTTVNGTAVKMIYQNGDYEIICHYWSDYVSAETTSFGWRYCDEKLFNDLVNAFLE